MLRFVVLSFTLFASIPTGILAGRIVGGYDVDITQAPHHVGVFVDNSYKCGGSIIANKIILTAAHCIFSGNRYVRYGSTYYANGGRTVTVLYGIEHEEYNPQTVANDIGLLFLAADIEFSNYAKPIALPNSNEMIPDGTIGQITGWGFLSDSGYQSPNLKGLKVPIINTRTCQMHYPYSIYSGMLCAGYKDSQGKGTCSGDSGSPLVVNGKQYGVASYVFGPCALGYYDVYTDVVYYRDWIRSKSGV